MITVQPGEIEVEERWYESNSTMRFKVAVPFNAETGNKDSAVGYFEVEPGNALPAHTDSAEEILLCLAGRVEVTLGNERSQISAGDMALVPAMVPHAIRNRGTETVRVLGFFSRVMVESTSQAWMSCSWMRVTRASDLKAGGRWSSRIEAIAALSSCATRLSQSSWT